MSCMALLALAMSLLAWPAAAAPASKLRRLTLDNGLRVVIAEDRRLPLVYVTLALGKGGVPRSAEQLTAEEALGQVVRATEPAIEGTEPRLRLWRRGTVTGYSQQRAAREVDAALELAAQQLSSALVAAGGARGAPVNELEGQLLMTALLSSKPAAPALAAAERLAADNAVLVVTGDVGTDALLLSIRRLFGGLDSKSGQPQAEPTPAAQTSQRHLSLRSPWIAGAQLGYGWRVPGVDQAERPVLLLVTALLTSRQPGSAWHGVVRQEAKAAELAAYSSGRPGQDVLRIELMLPKNETPFAAVGPIEAHARRLGLHGPSAVELVAAKRQLVTEHALAKDEPRRLAELLAWHELVFGDARALSRQHAAAMRVTSVQVKQFAARWLQPELASVVELTPLAPSAPEAGSSPADEPAADPPAAAEDGADVDPPEETPSP